MNGSNNISNAPASSQPRPLKRAEEAQKWKSMKDDVYDFYILENNTLDHTMNAMQQRHGLSASERKWKMQMKAWGFDKNICEKEMAALVAKADKRAREEEKETIFCRAGVEISPERINNFKRRKVSGNKEDFPDDPKTPANITYHTPRQVVEWDVAMLDVSGYGEEAANGQQPGQDKEMAVENKIPVPEELLMINPPLIKNIHLYPLLQACDEPGLHNIHEKRKYSQVLASTLSPRAWISDRLHEAIATARRRSKSGHLGKRKALVHYVGAIIVALKRGILSDALPKDLITEFLTCAQFNNDILSPLLGGTQYQSDGEKAILTYKHLVSLMEQKVGASMEIYACYEMIASNQLRLQGCTNADTEAWFLKAITGYQGLRMAERALLCKIALANCYVTGLQEVQYSPERHRDYLSSSVAEYIGGMDIAYVLPKSRLDYTFEHLSESMMPLHYKLRRLLKQAVESPEMLCEFGFQMRILYRATVFADRTTSIFARDIFEAINGKLSLVPNSIFGSLQALLYTRYISYLYYRSYNDFSGVLSKTVTRVFQCLNAYEIQGSVTILVSERAWEKAINFWHTVDMFLRPKHPSRVLIRTIIAKISTLRERELARLEPMEPPGVASMGSPSVSGLTKHNLLLATQPGKPSLSLASTKRSRSTAASSSARYGVTYTDGSGMSQLGLDYSALFP